MKHITRRRLLSASGMTGLAALGSGLVSGNAWAQEFPQRPITFVVPYPAGGSGDYIGRTVAEKLAQRWGQPVVVQNRSGAGGVIGVAAVARAPADGYTIVLTTASVTLTLAQQAKPAVDLFRDFETVGLVAVAPMVLVAHKDLPVQSAAELIALAKASPNQLFYGGNGQGGVGNLAIEMVKRRLGINLTYVPYQGGVQSIAAVVANQIPLAINDVGGMLPQIKAGAIKPILIASPKRFSLLPDTAGLSELGVNDVDIKASLGVVAPKGTPSAIIHALSREIQQILQLPDVQERFRSVGLEAVGSTPESYSEFLRLEDQQFRAAVKATGLSLNA